MTKAAVFPEPGSLYELYSTKFILKERTSFRDTNDIAVLQTDRNGLALDRGWFLVADFVHNLQYLSRNAGLFP